MKYYLNQYFIKILKTSCISRNNFKIKLYVLFISKNFEILIVKLISINLKIAFTLKLLFIRFIKKFVNQYSYSVLEFAE